MTELLGHCRELIAKLTANEASSSWDDFVAPLNDGTEHLSRAWGIVGHLHSVKDIPAWRDAYNDLLPEMTRFYSELGQNLALFSRYKTLAGSEEYSRLSPARRRIIDNEIRDFRLSGAELPDAQKPRFQELQEEAAALQARFSENLLDATNAHAEVVTDPADLAGLPPDVIEVARGAAEKAGIEGWRFTLHAPSFGPVMQYADNRRLRSAMYRAYATRASEFGRAELDNTPLIQQLLKLRAEEAHLLGYRTRRGITGRQNGRVA